MACPRRRSTSSRTASQTSRLLIRISSRISSASKAAAWSFTNAARVELKRQRTQVVGVHAGPVDTDMAAAFDLEKIPPADVATSSLDALEADEPEAFAEEYSRAVKDGLSDDQRALYPEIERQFLEMTGAEATAT